MSEPSSTHSEDENGDGFWGWKIEGVKNQYGSSGGVRPIDQEGTMPGRYTAQEALAALVRMNAGIWKDLDPYDDVTITLTAPTDDEDES